MDDRLGSLIPQPVSIRPSQGALTLTSMPDVRPTGNGDQATTQNAAATVRRLLTSVPWPGGVTAAQRQLCSVSVDAQLGPEAYHLAIEPDGITHPSRRHSWGCLRRADHPPAAAR